MKKETKVIIKKDKWDKGYIIAMVIGVIFTGFIAYGTVFQIPKGISESNLKFRNYSDVNPGAIGPRIPYIVYGIFKLDKEPKENVNISLTNLNTREKLPHLLTNTNGEYVFDLANLPHYFYYGDALLIKGCIGTLCTQKEIIVSGDKPGVKIDFDIS